jgi:polar amino acid transport system substrate-binding protein
LPHADDAAKKELAPTGKLRVGIAVGPTPGAGNVARDEASGGYRGVAIDLGTQLAQLSPMPPPSWMRPSPQAACAALWTRSA